MAPIAQARPDAYVFMQSHMVNPGGRASRSVFITTSYLGAISSLRRQRQDQDPFPCAASRISQLSAAETGLVCNTEWTCPVNVGAVEQCIRECNVKAVILHSRKPFQRCWLVICGIQQEQLSPCPRFAWA